MKTLGTGNSKGGVGKTSSAVELALASAERGIKTVLLDMDNQGNLSASFLTANEIAGIKHNTYEMIMGKEKLKPIKVRENLYLIPASTALLRLDKEELSNVVDPLEDRLEELSNMGFDLCIQDLPGNLGVRNLASLIASDAIYCPIELNKYSEQAFEEYILLIKKVKARARYNPYLEFLGVLPNLVKKISYKNNKRYVLVKEEREVYERLAAKHNIVGMLANREAIQQSASTGRSLLDVGRSDSRALAIKEVNEFATNVFSQLGLISKKVSDDANLASENV